LCDSTETSLRLMPFTSKSCQESLNAQLLIICRGVEPLTGDDIAEVVVFAAGRRENVVIADTLVFPSHQVSLYLC
jgi:NADP-dependent 3-hydroxy acid dehydrogenase YdfG